MNQNSPKTNVAQTQQNATKKPNERVGFSFSSGVTIKDPDSGKILVQLRCS
jgi:hypothetical protein